MQKTFVTFASANMHSARDTLAQQARRSRVFDTVMALGETDLSSDFFARVGDKLTAENRGYGFWCWKPHALQLAMSQMNDGDFLIYADAGCRFSRRNLERLQFYFERAAASTTGILGFSFFDDDQPERPFGILEERKWTKADTFAHFGLSDDRGAWTKPQISATVIVLQKRSSSVAFVDQWMQAIYDDFSIIDDTPSKLANDPDFIDHRHDQSIYSLLCYLHQPAYLSWLEIEADPRKRNSIRRTFGGGPIQARRRRFSHKQCLEQKIRSLLPGNWAQGARGR